jgi:hypothetical protein
VRGQRRDSGRESAADFKWRSDAWSCVLPLKGGGAAVRPVGVTTRKDTELSVSRPVHPSDGYERTSTDGITRSDRPFWRFVADRPARWVNGELRFRQARPRTSSCGPMLPKRTAFLSDKKSRIVSIPGPFQTCRVYDRNAEARSGRIGACSGPNFAIRNVPRLAGSNDPPRTRATPRSASLRQRVAPT